MDTVSGLAALACDAVTAGMRTAGSLLARGYMFGCRLRYGPDNQGTSTGRPATTHNHAQRGAAA